ncbi:MAG: hypothetical protein NVS3B17_23900 [Vulcanimicrobiaceae bacterium]
MQSAAMLAPDPASMLAVASETMALHDPDGFASALAMIYDPRTCVATYASAGHFGPALRSQGGHVVPLDVDGLLLGIAGSGSIRTRSVRVEEGATLVLYTDGIVELTRDLRAGERALYDAIANLAADVEETTAQRLLDAVLASRPATDDIAILVVHVERRERRERFRNPAIAAFVA